MPADAVHNSPCTPVLALSHAIRPMHRCPITFSGNEPKPIASTSGNELNRAGAALSHMPRTIHARVSPMLLFKTNPPFARRFRVRLQRLTCVMPVFPYRASCTA